jgi:anti-sigma factor RsiW
MDEQLNGDCRALREDLGAYVLGALAPGERAELEAHLASCGECRDELASLAGIPGLLSRLSLEEVDPQPELRTPPVERLLAGVAKRRRRDRFRLAVVAAASVLVVGGGVAAAVVLTSGGGEQEQPSMVLSSANARTHAHGQLALTAEPWGTSVTVQLAGVAPGTRCRLVVLGAGGQREIAGTWRASYDGTAQLSAATAIPVADLRGFVVERDGPRPVLRFNA